MPVIDIIYGLYTSARNLKTAGHSRDMKKTQNVKNMGDLR